MSLAARLALCLALVPLHADASRIYTMEVRGPIFTPVVQYLTIALEQAERAEADALLLEIDTPGGSLDATREIVQKILGAPLPVIVYVTPSGASATSAGTFITLAGHVAAMAPGTTIGAAHPVSVLPSEQPNEAMEKKVENYAVSFIEAIAAERGRNAKWAAEAVRESASITAEQALAKKVVDLVAPSREALLAAIDGRTVRVRGQEARLHTASPELHGVEMTLEQQFYFFLSHPTVIFLLFAAGAGALYVELTHPGAIVPGVVGAVALLLAAIGFSIVPINFTGASLLALGTLLLAAEVFVPSFGVLGATGMLCVAAGALLVFRTAEAPGLAVDHGVVAGAVFALGVLMIGLGVLVARARRRPVATGAESMIGAVGRVVRRLDPSGKVRVMGELWDATLEGAGAAEEGEDVEIVRLEGLRLVVRPRRRS